MLLAELVATADAVARTSSRNGKIVALAALLRRLDPSEAEAAACFLTGLPRGGKIGTGYASVYAVTEAPAASPELSILDLDAVFQDLRVTTGSGSAGRRSRILASLFARATAGEQDFIRRLLVGELRQGALAGILSEAIARAADVPAGTVRRAAMLCGNLPRTAEIALRDGAAGLAAVGFKSLRPVLPMLASTARTVAEALAVTGPASVEWKLDGIRIQVHRAGDDVRVYTRNLNEISDRLPDVVTIASSLDAGRVVLDGEVVGLDADQRPHAFQDVMSRVGRGPSGAEMAMVPYFFDVVHVDGTDLMDAPLRERLDVLEQVSGAWRIPSVRTDEPAVGEAMLRGALEAGHEGVVVKSLESPYQAGRRGKSWLKVKPSKTFDLVVLGAEWGHGRRQGWLSNLHLGARAADGSFVMVGKTFKGLTDELLRWQTVQLLELETGRKGIAVFVRPELVVEIELDGVQVSTRYPGGVALRFARVKRYRQDKRPSESDTIEALRELLPR